LKASLAYISFPTEMFQGKYFEKILTIPIEKIKLLINNRILEQAV